MNAALVTGSGCLLTIVTSDREHPRHLTKNDQLKSRAEEAQSRSLHEIVSGPELTHFTVLAHDAEARDRDLFVAAVMPYITIVMVDRDMPN